MHACMPTPSSPSPTLPHSPPLSLGTIRLYCKGADAKVLPRLKPTIDPALLQNTHRNLHLFATKGLRTLLLGTRVLQEEEYNDWDVRYQAACADLDNRDARINALADEIEQNLELVGVTAIEDKLQVCGDGGIGGWGGVFVVVVVGVYAFPHIILQMNTLTTEDMQSHTHAITHRMVFRKQWPPS